MSGIDHAAVILGSLDLPADPPREFADELLTRLLAEIGAEDAPAPSGRRRQLPRTWPRLRFALIAIAVVLVFCGLVAAALLDIGI